MEVEEMQAPLLDTSGAAVAESVPSGAAGGDHDLMDEGDWRESQREADKENGDTADETGLDSQTDTIPQRVVVRHNKQDVELSAEQLIEAAQKGLDYDRIRESRDRYLEPIERLSRQTGMSTDQFLQAMDGMVRANAVGAKKAEFMRMGADESIAGYMAQMAWENETLKNQSGARMTSRQEMHTKINRDIVDFTARFPKVDELPGEVIQSIRGGESPVVAYQGFLIRENDKKMNALEQNRKNRTNSPGPARSIGAEMETDAFLQGFLGR